MRREDAADFLSASEDFASASRIRGAVCDSDSVSVGSGEGFEPDFGPEVDDLLSGWGDKSRTHNIPRSIGGFARTE
jgi:hypothetical protein